MTKRLSCGLGCGGDMTIQTHELLGREGTNASPHDPIQGKILVTGATGFLGGALTRKLCAYGAQVIALGRNCERGLTLERLGARFVPVDLRDKAAVRHACDGVDVVVHSAALSSAWGKRSDFIAHNVDATRHVVSACIAQGVRRLVHISSPSVISRHEPQEDLDEETPMPQHFVSCYSETKALAEGVVQEAILQGLDAVILRPKAIYGPGDRALFPRIIESLRSGRLPIIGDGQTYTQITHVDDVVAAIELAISTEAARGQTYLITGDEEVNLWELFTWIAEYEGVSPPSRHMSAKRAMRVGAILETVWRWLRLPKEPPLTRYKASILSHTQLYSIERARRELNYQPKVPWREGLTEFLRGVHAVQVDAPIDSVDELEVTPEDSAEAHAGSTSVLSSSTTEYSVKLRIFNAGRVIAPDFIFRPRGEMRWVKVPAMFALLEHPIHGYILFDTGHSTRFYDATRAFPFRLYRWATPTEITLSDHAAAQLSALGVEPQDLSMIVISHFDPDHIGGLKDFADVPLVCHWRAWSSIAGKRGWSALKVRLIPGLLPEDASSRIRLLPDFNGPSLPHLGPTYDLFNDGSVRLVELKGHAAGHIGALLSLKDGAYALLCADGIWTRDQLTADGVHGGLHKLIAANRKQQVETYRRLALFRREHPEIRYLPCHCFEAESEVLDLWL